MDSIYLATSVRVVSGICWLYSLGFRVNRENPSSESVPAKLCLAAVLCVVLLADVFLGALKAPRELPQHCFGARRASWCGADSAELPLLIGTTNICFANAIEGEEGL